MLRRRIQTILLAMATFSCATPGQTGGGAQPPEISIGQDAAGSTVALRQGQRLAVTLSANPTTGYIWEQVPGAEAILARQGDAKFTPESAKIGAGGVYRFTYQAVRPGRAPLKFILHRSFEKEAPPAKTFEVNVAVE